MERGTVDRAVAFKKLTKSAWKMFRKDHDTEEVVEAGVQVLIQHDEWAEILKAISLLMYDKDKGESKGSS